MGLADLWNVPNTDEEMATWSQLHFAEHVLINQAILEQHNVALPLYLINPVNLADPQAFLNLHQQMHGNTDAVLGVASQNLTEVDWNDPGQREGWIQLNAQLHVAESNALEIG
jgi:hypothetical protein